MKKETKKQIKNTAKAKEQISVGKDFAAEEKMLNNEQAQDSNKSEASAKAPPRSLDEIWGIQKKSKYQFLTEDEYRSHLDGLNVADIQRECLSHGRAPKTGRAGLIKELINEFRAHQNRLNTAHLQPKVLGNRKEIERLLERGQNTMY